MLAVGIWYYRGGHSKTQAENSSANAPGAPGGYGQNGAAGFNPIVPVVVATAQHGDVPIYFSGLGTVTAYNTVTVHSRVDGQLVSVAFKEGQFVHQGDVLAQIDPRPFQVVLEQAEGALAKDQAQRKDAETNFERYKLLFNEGVIPKQQLDTQQAQVGQFDGAIKTDQAMIDSAKLQLSFTHITAPISGRIGLAFGGCRKHGARYRSRRIAGDYAIAADLRGFQFAAGSIATGSGEVARRRAASRGRFRPRRYRQDRFRYAGQHRQSDRHHHRNVQTESYFLE